MDLRELLSLDRIHGARGGAHPAGADPAKFESVLEELRALADRTRDGTEKARTKDDGGLAGFADALRRADADYAALMEVRRRLEAAFRSRGS
jgi:hypothetical protein